VFVPSVSAVKPPQGDEVPTATVTVEVEAEAPVAPRRPAPTFTVLVYGRERACVRELARGDRFVLGRSAPSELCLDDRSLSRQHARLSWAEDGVDVEDLGSKNGTRVGGERVTRARVRPGADLAFGSVVASVRESSTGEAEGFCSYDRFTERLRDEWVRARGFGRPLSLVFLRSEARAGHVSRWAARILAEVRPVDAVAVCSPSAVAVLLPELDLAQAAQSAAALSRPRPDEPALLAGVACAPHHATSSESLFDVARAACLAATGDRRVVAGLADALPSGPDQPVVRDARMLEVYRLARRAALGRAPVLVLGETGTGKELVARAVHDAGPRRSGPFRAINCAAIPPTLIESILFGHEKGAFTGAVRREKGIFEEAAGGTLLLDEIGELPLTAQATLLRVLETKRVARIGSAHEVELDVRVLAATHCDLDRMVTARTFRSDLLHRIAVLTIEIPPLRQRRDEIEPLAEAFLVRARADWQSPVERIDPAALARLRDYDWPGNVRELRNVVERAVMIASGDALSEEDLPERLRKSPEERPSDAPPSLADDEGVEQGSFAAEIRKHEVRLIEGALARTGGNQKEAAQVLGMPLRTLVHKIRAYDLKKKP
jgi:two-component system response regulator AtoC